VAIEKHPCENGITEECFKAYPQWAKRAFALKLMHTLCPGQITRRLPKGLRPGMIGFPPGWTPGIPLPSYLGLPGMIGFPPGWTPGDPLSPYTGQDLTPGVIIPSGGAIPPIFLTPFEPGPPHRVSPTAPGVTVVGTFTAQGDKREGRSGSVWTTIHGAATGNILFLGETETDTAIRARWQGIDMDIYRSFFDFDLSGIPAGATLKVCKLTLQSYGAFTCDASIQEGTQTGDPFGGDYSAFTGSLFGMKTWIIGSNVFTLNVPGQIYIQSKFGATAKLCMREYDHDYLNVSPADGEDFKAGLYWSGAAVAANRPKLTITYKT